MATLTSAQGSPANLQASLGEWIAGNYHATRTDLCAWLTDGNGMDQTLATLYPDLHGPHGVLDGGGEYGFDDLLRESSPLLAVGLPMPVGQEAFYGAVLETAEYRVPLWMRCAVWNDQDPTRIDHGLTALQMANAMSAIQRLLRYHRGNVPLSEWSSTGPSDDPLAYAHLTIQQGPIMRPDYRVDWTLGLSWVQEVG
jgi:hypothetical protein